MGFFQDLFGQSGADASRNAGRTIAAGEQQAFDYAQPQYQQAKTDITQGYGAAGSTWQPIYNTGQAGSQFYADITGVNGPEGQARARAAFQTDPGYQFALTQGQQAIERNAAKYGGGAQGGLSTALADYTTGAASKQYNDWVNRVAPFLNYSVLGAQGLAGTQTGAAQSQAAIDKALGDLGYQTKAGEAQALASGELGATKSQQAASQNLFNQGVNLAGKLLGYAGPSFNFGGGGGGAVGNVSDYPFNIDQLIMAG